MSGTNNNQSKKNADPKTLEELMAENLDQAKDILDKIKRILAENTSKDINEITNDASIASDLGADSLTQAEIVLALENEFNIEIPDEVASAITSLSEAVIAVWKLLQKSENQAL